ncbi:MAG: agglutinin biogenesis protein MshP [Noviherbaspirillum sp.]
MSAIFLLVVLAGLGVAMVNISSTQHTSSALDVQGARAYHAARAGIEWGLYRQLIGTACAATTSFALPAGTTLSPFTVTVTCAVTAGPPAGVNLNRWLITSTACTQPDAGGNCPNPNPPPNYVQRVLQVQF